VLVRIPLLGPSLLGPLLLVLALLGLPRPAVAEPQPVPIVIGQSYTLVSEAGVAHRINIHTPAGYSQGAARFPVLYLLDGGEMQDFHHITGLAQLGSTPWGPLQPLIVVGIESVDRRNELTPPTADQALRKQYPTVGGSAAFRRFLLDSVKPFVEARYRTTADTALMGESLAGLFVVETLLARPGSFRRYIAISPSLWWDDQALADGAAARLATLGLDAPGSLWLSLGSEGPEMQAGMDSLVAALAANAPATLDWRSEPRPAETHGSIYHGTAYEALKAFYPKPAP
jgi:predicted alpha/beta superfamily hydrolase